MTRRSRRIDRAIARTRARARRSIVAGNIHLAAKDLPAAAIAAYARAAALPPGAPARRRARRCCCSPACASATGPTSTPRARRLPGRLRGRHAAPAALRVAGHRRRSRRCTCAARGASCARQPADARATRCRARARGRRASASAMSAANCAMHAVGHLMARLLECHDRDGLRGARDLARPPHRAMRCRRASAPRSMASTTASRHDR